MTETRYTFAMGESHGCWFAKLPDADSCSGALGRCHLLSKQTIRREIWQARKWKTSGLLPETFFDLVWDERVWVPGCSHHHHLLDQSRRLRVPRDLLPESVESFAEQWERGWWLSREYGELREAA